MAQLRERPRAVWHELGSPHAAWAGWRLRRCVSSDLEIRAPFSRGGTLSHWILTVGWRRDRVRISFQLFYLGG